MRDVPDPDVLKQQLSERCIRVSEPDTFRVVPGSTRVFGSIPAVPEGMVFSTRADAAAARIHRPLQAGISGGAAEGADSVVISGGYEDDVDLGDEVIYTGHGGNVDGVQVADQTLTGGNMALAVSADHGLPVRVLRGHEGDPTQSPISGYRYDGLYYVDSYWTEAGASGHKIWRFRLVKAPPESPIANPPSGSPPTGDRQRRFTTSQRLIRNTAVTQWVKELYDYHCQFCDLRIETPAGGYAEGAHVRPVGQPHNGPDDATNVICLCPNDHVRFDRGVIGFDDSGTLYEHSSGKVLGKVNIRPDHPLNASHAHYHWSVHQQ